MKYYMLIVAICLLNSVHTQNCSHTLIGEIKDFHDGTPMSGATVYIETLNTYTTADINGKFTIKDICDGKLVLVISHIGCETQRIEVDINGDTFKEIDMEHHIEELHEVKVSGSAPKSLTKTAQETQLNTETLERFSALNLGDALKEVSGVSSINTGNSIVKPVINGLHSSRISVITNGVLLQDQEWGIEHAPNIDLNAAGTVNVIKGANALAYSGDAIGGVVVLKPERISLNDSLYGKTILGGQTNGRGYNMASSLTKTWKEGWFVNGQASMKRFGDFEAPDYTLTNTGLDSKGLNLNLGFKTFEKGFNINYSYLSNDIGILRAAHIGSINDLVNAINNGNPVVIEDFSYDINAPRQEVTHQIFKAEFYKRFKRFGRFLIQYDFQNNQRFEYDVRRTDNSKPAIDLSLNTHALRTELKLDANTNSIYTFGIHTRYQNNRSNPETGVRRLIPDYDRYDIGVFAISNFKWGDKTNIDFGLRYDYNRVDAQKFYLTSRWLERNYDDGFNNLIIASVFGKDIQYGVVDFNASQLLTNPVYNFHNISISAGISHKISKAQSILANYALSQRSPNPSELFSDGLHHSAARIELGDLRMNQETSNRFGVTYQLNSNKLKLNAEGFLNHIKDFIQITPFGTEQTIRGAFPVWNYAQTNALLFGVDLNVGYEINKHWNINNTSAFIKGRDLKAKTALIDIPSFRTTNVIGYTNKSWLNFNANLESEWVFRQNDFPDFNFETLNPTTQQMVVVDISTPPQAYHLLHFRSDITVSLSDKTNMNIGLNVSNILNTSYREYLNRLRYFADDLGRNVMLQIKLNY
ncbi:iron complex outermembrane recepter protein [Hyunsoonleella jejuensis]|uniref:Iron complex outermembrane recepter protein n=1 Tax=Hyunsoonleella jejuensis TaxID=419940 RepID=A0A1H9JCK1_9FLAO|nr:TonB-dependent receptor [Hyunsoonleella jejuensis]SEQ84493.1 iron complex outermembrane recepter protein [Hyunsoonleella jejuensis]